MIRYTSAWLMLLLALSLLMLPLQWVFAAVLAAVFHEFCHYGALRLCGGRLIGISVGAAGTQMQVGGLTRGKELICALAGPAGSLSLLLVARWLSRTAICAGFQGIYNLLPIFPLDGGRVLRCAFEMLLPADLVEPVCLWVQRICLTAILLLGIYGCFCLRLGGLPLVAAVFMILRSLQGKIPCKPRWNSVQ